MTVPTAFASVELRRYRLKPGRRDELIALFETQFLESQEACGMVPLGHFRDLDDADAFVWLRGFPRFEQRATALERFYVQSEAWKRHRDAANDTMLDSDDVLLLRPARSGSGINVTSLVRPPLDADESASRYLWILEMLLPDPASEATVAVFESAALPHLVDVARDASYFITDRRPNEFPKLPVRENENAFVACALCDTLGDIEKCREIIDGAFLSAMVQPVIDAKHRRLVPGRRSLMR